MQLSSIAQVASRDEGESLLEKLGLTETLIRRAIEHADAEDARIDSAAFDPTHRGINRWGHVLAFLRREAKPFGWTWDPASTALRSVVSPGDDFQICVASATWDGPNGGPRTLPKGIYTLLAVEDNIQQWLPFIGPVDSHKSSSRMTLILCLGRTVGVKSKTVNYRYEVSIPNGVTGAGERRRVVSWKHRFFEGTLDCERQSEPLREEEHYDHEEIEGVEGLVRRK